MKRKANQRRFLSVYLRPDRTEHLGTGPDRQCVHYYANVQNVIRFGLAKDVFPPGQYKLYAWPEGTSTPTFVMYAYKRV